jgi:hypothetical protein
MLAHNDPRTPGDWDHALVQEAQPLDPRSPHGVVLCGVPKPAMRAAVTLPFFERALAELRARYRYVLLDVGADLLGAEAMVHRAALGLADQILLVGTADLVGLSRLRAALNLCQTQLGLPPSHVALVINRYERRRHHRRGEIAWALETPLAAVVPYDYAGTQRAFAAQRPVTLMGRSGAGRALLALAGRIHAGRIALPAEARGRSLWWYRAVPASPAPVGPQVPAAPIRPAPLWSLLWRRRGPAPAPPHASGRVNEAALAADSAGGRPRDARRSGRAKERV